MRNKERPSLIFLAVMVLCGCSADNGASSFVTIDEDIYEIAFLAPIYNLNDAGVGDLNADGKYELWTTNHSSYQWIRQFSQDSEMLIKEIELPQDSRFPGIEYGGPELPTNAILDKPMLIQTLRSSVVLHNGSENPNQLLQGSIHIPWETEVTMAEHAFVERRLCQPVPCFQAEFQVQHGGELQVTPVPAPSDGFPIKVSLDESMDLSLLSVGRRGIQPNTHDVEFALKDRHAIAQADVLGDSRPEFFVSRGGARGRLAAVDPGAADELFSVGQGEFLDEVQNTGIAKDGCPGRAARWIDIDADGDLDLLQVCGRADDVNGDAKNRLYVQLERGVFVEKAADFGLALEGSGQFGWLPMNSGGAVLLWATSERIELYLQTAFGKRFTLHWSARQTLGSKIGLSFLDTDFDGQQEVLVTSAKENLLLDGLPMEPKIVRLVDLGGPQASLDGELGDFDSDGRPDVFLIPQGLYSFGSDGKLNANDGFAISSPKPIRNARSNWLDVDGDGDLDLWLVVQDPYLAPGKLRSLSEASPDWFQAILVSTVESLAGPLDWHDRQWHSAILLQTSSKARLFAVDVVGPEFNRFAIGATVTVSYEDLREQSQVVGIADGSRFSQTHYRRYFGVGEADQITKIKVVFLDGAVVEVMNPSAQQVLRVEHPGATLARAG